MRGIARVDLEDFRAELAIALLRFNQIDPYCITREPPEFARDIVPAGEHDDAAASRSCGAAALAAAAGACPW